MTNLSEEILKQNSLARYDITNQLRVFSNGHASPNDKPWKFWVYDSILDRIIYTHAFNDERERDKELAKFLESHMKREEFERFKPILYEKCQPNEIPGMTYTKCDRFGNIMKTKGTDLDMARYLLGIYNNVCTCTTHPEKDNCIIMSFNDGSTKDFKPHGVVGLIFDKNEELKELKLKELGSNERGERS